MNELNISKTLIAKRKEKGITQDDIAKYIGVSKASVSKWETGQSYPDIAFLPQLASFFNISVDELINYRPQMKNEEIKKLYLRLAKDFAEKPFDDVMSMIRETTKKYYSCFPLLFHLGALIINHYMLAKETQQQEIIEEAMELFSRTRTESDDFKLCKQSNIMEAMCHLLLNKPEQVIELLEVENTAVMNERNMLSTAYSMLGKVEKSKEILQINLYENLFSMLQNLTSLLQLEKADIRLAKNISERIISISDTFDVEKLHPAIMLSAYLNLATVHMMQNDVEHTLEALQNYCDLATDISYPITLHGDMFFDRIETWLSELELGVNAPRNDKTIRKSILEGVKSNPVFSPLTDNFRYQQMIEKLTTIVGGQ